MIVRSFVLCWLVLLGSIPAKGHPAVAEPRPYKPEVCAYCQAATWCEIRANSKPQCRACQVERFFERVLYPPFGFKLQDWQRKALRDLYGTVKPENGLRRYRKAYISMAKQNGKQLDVETMIPTPAGWARMGDLQVGDYVFSEAGLPVRIVAKSEPDDTERAFRVGFGDGSSIVAGARHEWFAETYSGQSRGIFSTLDMYGRSPGAFRIPLADALCLPDSDLPVDPYIAGFWLGNGCSTKPEITVNRQDLQYFEDNVRLAGLAIGASWEQPGQSNTFRIPGLRPLLVEHFSKKRIPPVYLRASTAQRWSLAAGLMDSDGCISTNKGQAIYATSVPELAADVVELLRSLSVKSTCNMVISDRYGKSNAPHYRVQFTAHDDQPLSRLPRKLERRWRRIDGSRSHFHYPRIEEVDRRPMQCIQVESGSHMYLAGESFVPTHNSFLLGGLPLYHLLVENEFNPEAYGVASAKDQAGIVFKAAAMLVQGNPLLKEKLKVLESTKRIVRRDGGGAYVVLSADGDVQDGKRPSLLMFDELHRFTRKKAETVRTVLMKGMISRAPVVNGVETGEPLMLQTTTSGDEHECPLWYAEYDYAKHILDGSIQDPSYYALIYQADPAKIASDSEYWKTREARVAANPSHQDNGGFLADSSIEADMKEAVLRPEKYTDYVRLNLNVPAATTDTPVVNMALWYANGGEEDLRIWPEYDVEYLIRRWDLKGRRVFVGVDLAWVIDMTALSLVFPPEREGQKWKLVFFSWLPQDRVPEIERVTRAPLKDWVHRKFVETVPGSRMSLLAVEDKIRWAKKQFAVQAVCYDPWGNLTRSMEVLAKEGFTCVEVEQKIPSLTAATKEFIAMYTSGEFQHGNNPVANWHVSCLSLLRDAKDNVMPRKPDRDTSKKRIDLVAATVDALTQALAPAPRGPLCLSRGVLG